jgi:hypothetical protein
MQKPRKRSLTAALSAAVAASVMCRAELVSSSGVDETVYVGILDEAREEIWHGKTGVLDRRVVMPAFEKSNSEWQSVTHFALRDVKWTVAFDSGNLGQVESKASSDVDGADQINSNSSRTKLSIVTPTTEVPTVGKSSRWFTV